ncbi:MAG: Holliday junction branch migration protein RuvA [Bacteroidota bacterium]
MYAYLNGRLETKTPTQVYMDIAGVGYLVHISLHTYSKIESLEATKLYTHLYVKEDALTLYGFADPEERELFILLISVSGIGPNTARIVLSSMTPVEVRTAIVTDNDAAFKKVKGVGPKTAKRIILDLQGKIKEGAAILDTTAPAADRNVEEAINALVALGFQKAKVQKVIQKLPQRDLSNT